MSDIAYVAVGPADNPGKLAVGCRGRSNGLAITATLRGDSNRRKWPWSITHERSGLLVCSCRTLPIARVVLDELVDGLDWNSVKDRAGKRHKVRWLAVMVNWSRRDVARMEVVG